ncbi:hypothetical protein [Sphingomonas sp. TDK1]|uniref:hypothetical protein n=1 Tax=Sphingomonas sp. TDK1 TaxID=453247 RepID=UPI001E445732|nr:hypothetical protein [Sphingomonas sp. TDK1]
MTVATYEPLILRWISGWTLRTVAGTIAKRKAKADILKRHAEGAASTAIAIASVRATTRVKSLPSAAAMAEMVKGRDLVNHDDAERAETAGVHRLELKGFPQAVAYRGVIHPFGLTLKPSEQALRAKSMSNIADDVPTYVAGNAISREDNFDLKAAQSEVFRTMVQAVKQAPDGDVGKALQLHLKDSGIYQFFPEIRIEEALSPIGIAHFYRQLYFNAEEGFGPIEQAFTVAPLETLEVVYETVRKQIHEEVLEVGLEQVSETATEEKNTDEVSDKVSSMIQRDSSAAMSATVSGSIGVWQASASANASFKNASQRGREQTSRRLKEVTNRAAERITKTFKLTTRDVTDITTTNLTRRIIRNDSPAPVSYGLRRVLRRVNVKVQDLGPRLVWQLYVRTPGKGLARSKFVHFRESGPISVPNEPPGLPPRPVGGTDTGTTSSSLKWDNGRKTWYVTIVVQPGSDRKVTSVSIDSITDLEGGGKDDLAPSPKNNLHWGDNWDAAAHTFTTNIAILEGDGASVSVNFTYAWDPAGSVIADWEAKRQAAVAAITEELLNKKFEREKALITERSKIKPRPAADLRKEERYEVMNRMISHLFANGGNDPSPLEIEYFHRYFEIDAMFTYTHPSWWKPRYTPVATGAARPAYEITADSEPAPLGSSLGWAIQLDGDARRNEFLNSPWIRVCLPIYPGRESEAIDWLSRHVEGEEGYDVNNGPLADLLKQVAQYRDQEAKLGINGPDYVTVDSTIGDEPGDPNAPLTPENIYPIVQEFEVTVPTEGFVYDELKLV